MIYVCTSSPGLNELQSWVCVHKSREDPVKSYTAELLSAASEGQVGEVRKFVEMGADVGAHCQNGCTALHLAAMKGHAETVKLLVDLGAYVRARDEFGRMPLDLAVDNGHAETVTVLEQMVSASIAQSQVKVPITHCWREYLPLTCTIYELHACFQYTSSQQNRRCCSPFR